MELATSRLRLTIDGEVHAQRTERQASGLAEVTTAIREITERVRQTADLARQTSDLVEVFQRKIEAMNGIARASGEISQVTR